MHDNWPYRVCVMLNPLYPLSISFYRALARTTEAPVAEDDARSRARPGVHHRGPGSGVVLQPADQALAATGPGPPAAGGAAAARGLGDEQQQQWRPQTSSVRKPRPLLHMDVEWVVFLWGSSAQKGRV